MFIAAPTLYALPPFKDQKTDPSSRRTNTYLPEIIYGCIHSVRPGIFDGTLLPDESSPD